MLEQSCQQSLEKQSLGNISFNFENSNIYKLYIPCNLGKCNVYALLDCGAQVSCISLHLFSQLKEQYFKQLVVSSNQLITATKENIKTKGKYEMTIKIKKQVFLHHFYVLDNLAEHLILGCDFMQKYKILIDFSKNMIKIPLPKKIINVIGQTDKPTFSKDPPLDHLQDADRQFIEQLLSENKDICADKMTQLGLAIGTEHCIKLTNDEAVYTPPYRVPQTQMNILRNYLDEMLENNIVRPTKSSAFASPVVIVPKKTGDWRICIDYRKLNKVTIKDRYPLTRIDDIFNYLAGSKFFTTLDLFSGYWQIKMRDEDIHKTAFICEFGHFEFVRMPFGLCNAPASFQKLMDKVLAPYLRKFVLVYLDDIVIFSKTFQEHLEHIQSIFEILRKSGLKIKTKKCEFAKKELVYLGHIISINGIRPNPKKTECVANFPTPNNSDQVRTFLGLSGYYRKFIKNYADIAKPLTELTKLDATWKWTEKEIRAFNHLKHLLTTNPILGYPDPYIDYVLQTDASEYAIGAVLAQIQDGNEVVIAYMSKILQKNELKWAVIEKELYAIVYALKYFRTYIYGRKVTVFTDHKPLQWIAEKKRSVLSTGTLVAYFAGI